MTDNPLQSTKRELHALVGNRRVVVGLCAAGVIAGIAGPFGTAEHLRLAPRIAYWLVLVWITFLTGTSLTGSLIGALARRGTAPAMAALPAALLAGLVITAEVALLNWIVFDLPPSGWPYIGGLALNGMVISVIITGAALLLDADGPAADPAPGPDLPALLDRMPLDKRGPLISLSVQDHYVDIVTTRGREMLLLRLSDAIRETQPTPGLQVHRSHWVALDQVSSARRDGARAVLTMSDGRDIPVSRSHVAAVKEAGLFPG